MTRLCVIAKDSQFYLVNVLHSHPTCLEEVPVISDLDNSCQSTLPTLVSWFPP